MAVTMRARDAMVVAPSAAHSQLRQRHHACGRAHVTCNLWAAPNFTPCHSQGTISRSSVSVSAAVIFSPLARAAMQAFLEKLEPEAMMEDGGLQKAVIALNILKERASEPSTPSEIAAAGGVMILLQTALLHPEPALRESAATVVTRCILQGDAAFIKAAMAKNLPIALVRMCSEQDRRAQPQDGEGPAVDPDLPVRRVALDALEHMLFEADIRTASAVMSSPGAPGVPYSLIASTDASIRERATAMLRRLLLTPDARLELIEFMTSFVKDSGEKVSQALAGALADASADTRSCALEVLRFLRGRVEALNRDLVQAGALAALEGVDGAADIVEWLQQVPETAKAEE